MSITVGKVGIADASFGTLPLSQISVGPVIVWERNKEVPNSMVLTFDETATDIELPLEQYLTTEWDVDWGDGTQVKMGKAHSYTDGRKHRVTITGSAMWSVKAGYPGKIVGGEGLVSVATVGTCPIRAWYTCSFRNCNKLESVDDGLFNGVVRYDEGYATHSSTSWSFDSFFSGCTQLSIIPENLFSNAPKSAWPDTSTKSDFNIGFRRTFYGTGIYSVPDGLFSGLPEATYTTNKGGILNFDSTFMDCKKMTTLGRIFDHLQKEAQFFSTNFMCAGCTSLGMYGFSEVFEVGGIPTGLFKYMPKIVGNSYYAKNVQLSSCFQSCTGLQGIPSDILDGVPNSGRTDLASMFAVCTGLAYDVPAVWSTHGSTAHSGFYAGCTSAPNYAAIPSGWK